MTAPTSHEISQLAWLRRHDPKAAMDLATAAGKQSDDANTSRVEKK